MQVIKGVLLSCQIKIGFDIITGFFMKLCQGDRSGSEHINRVDIGKKYEKAHAVFFLFWTIRCHRFLSALKKRDKIKLDFEQREKARRAGFVHAAGPR